MGMRGRTPLVLAGVTAGAVGVAEVALSRGSDQGGPGQGFVVHVVVACVLVLIVLSARLRPLAGLGLLLVLELFGVVTGTEIHTDEVVAAVVMYQCARRGSSVTLWLSGLLMPIAYLFSGMFLTNPGTEAVRRVDRASLAEEPVAAVLLVIMMAAPLALPWLAGLTFRWRATAERGRRELVRAQARAEAQEHQARLANDVHDVVGHSLSVILTQAESARYLDVRTPPEVQAVLDTISESARGSLTEVRQVLAAEPIHRDASDLDGLVHSLSSSGVTVRDRVMGVPRPLPPEVATVAHRVLQEMLTNAIKHGEGPIRVVRDWREDLRLVVSNRPREDSHSDGLGLTGMRRRVHSAQGKLEVRRSSTLFTVDAHLPLHGAKEHP
ncbi:hypothetical protein N802_15635 [Knoellia sinensis KCTC 19936]|uniref:histidine kinase n=1 Tax=Knoellia sinensis KCTC 19936 TaxID=1385520 RepID=A0A0A0J796_9MICO|nr:histidine kinase [Knoellia sinensis]KGN33008.1 hypothetical protein N802_15635 [Knoellia sinensis KCTC 19936]